MISFLHNSFILIYLFKYLLSQEANVLKSLLSGHEVQLPEGAFGTLSERILRLFTEVKCNLNEQSQDLDNTPIVSIFLCLGVQVNRFEHQLHSFRLYLIRWKRNLLYEFAVKLHMPLVLVVHNFYGMSF